MTINLNNLTNKQKSILDFINNFNKEKKYIPTIREIANHFNITVKGAFDHTEALRKKGFIKKIPNIARGIIILNDGE